MTKVEKRRIGLGKPLSAVSFKASTFGKIPSLVMRRSTFVIATGLDVKRNET
jgi:hypothetical protein